MATKRKAPHASVTAAIARNPIVQDMMTAALDHEALQKLHKLSDAEFAKKLDDAMEDVKRFCEEHGTTEKIERLRSLINKYRETLSAKNP